MSSMGRSDKLQAEWGVEKLIDFAACGFAVLLSDKHCEAASGKKGENANYFCSSCALTVKTLPSRKS